MRRGRAGFKFQMLALVSLVALLAVPLPALGQDGQTDGTAQPASLLTTIEAQCTAIEGAISTALGDLSVPDACKAPESEEDEEGEKEETPAIDPEACRAALVAQLTPVVRAKLESASGDFRRAAIVSLEADTLNPLEVQRLYDDLDEELAGLSARTAGELQSIVQGVDPKSLDLAALASTTAIRFGRLCRRGLSSDAAEAQYLVNLQASLQKSSEADLVSELTKEDGFSRMVRCYWIEDQMNRPRLDCKPGLLVNGQDSSGIVILPPPGDPTFRLAWVQAVTAEESRPSAQSGAPLGCPNFGDDDPRALTCDELCFLHQGRCRDKTFRQLETGSAEVAVYLPRWFGPSYGCKFGWKNECAISRLRGESPGQLLQREKLSLRIQGKTPFISVKAMDSEGRLAEGRILVGYQTWRVETGGFMALIDDDGVDDELVTAPADGDAGMVVVRKIRKDDDYGQETGIFLNFIPRNYEWLGVGVGFAAGDGEAPSVYSGMSLRLRSFGHRGLAAFTFGVAMREVNRFPDVTADGETLYAADSALLQPDERFDFAPYVGIQLGFSFGPIQVPGDE